MNPGGLLAAVWMLPCTMCMSSFSRVAFFSIGVPQSNKFILLVERFILSDVESIGLLEFESGKALNYWVVALFEIV